MCTYQYLALQRPIPRDPCRSYPATVDIRAQQSRAFPDLLLVPALFPNSSSMPLRRVPVNCPFWGHFASSKSIFQSTSNKKAEKTNKMNVRQNKRRCNDTRGKTDDTCIPMYHPYKALIRACEYDHRHDEVVYVSFHLQYRTRDQPETEVQCELVTDLCDGDSG
jgi:hypothetical protein